MATGLGAGSGQDRLPALGSWAEGLALQVNLLTWWPWLAAGGEGVHEELRSSLSQGMGLPSPWGEGSWAQGDRRATSPAPLPHTSPDPGAWLWLEAASGLPNPSPCRASCWSRGQAG